MFIVDLTTDPFDQRFMPLQVVDVTCHAFVAMTAQWPENFSVQMQPVATGGSLCILVIISLHLTNQHKSMLAKHASTVG